MDELLHLFGLLMKSSKCYLFITVSFFAEGITVVILSDVMMGRMFKKQKIAIKIQKFDLEFRNEWNVRHHQVDIVCYRNVRHHEIDIVCYRNPNINRRLKNK